MKRKGGPRSKVDIRDNRGNASVQYGYCIGRGCQPAPKTGDLQYAAC